MQQIYNHCTRYNNISNIKCSKNTTDSIIVHATTTYLVQQATYAVDTINVHILPSCALHDSSLCLTIFAVVVRVVIKTGER